MINLSSDSHPFNSILGILIKVAMSKLPLDVVISMFISLNLPTSKVVPRLPSKLGRSEEAGKGPGVFLGKRENSSLAKRRRM